MKTDNINFWWKEKVIMSQCEMVRNYLVCVTKKLDNISAVDSSSLNSLLIYKCSNNTQYEYKQ